LTGTVFYNPKSAFRNRGAVYSLLVTGLWLLGAGCGTSQDKQNLEVGMLKVEGEKLRRSEVEKVGKEFGRWNAEGGKRIRVEE